MTNANNRTKIIVAIIAAVGLIAAAYIQFFPWNKKINDNNKLRQEYIISGTVIDESTNLSISQAEVSVIGRNEIDYTQQNGNFKLLIKDSVDHVRIRVTKRNYLSYDKAYDIPSGNIIIQMTYNKE